LTAQANELQLPIARVHNGLFEQFLGAAGVDIAKNTVGVYSEALKKPLPVTGPSYLAAVLGELVALPPAETLGRTFTVVEYEATGQDFIDALAKVNGSQPAFTPYTAEAEAAAHASGIFGALAASLQHKWAFGSFPNNDAFNPASIPRRTVEQSVTSLKQ
jgi:hypothetical protein